MTYTVIYEKGPTSWGAYVPDLPGVITVGDTREEVEGLIREAHCDPAPGATVKFAILGDTLLLVAPDLTKIAYRANGKESALTANPCSGWNNRKARITFVPAQDKQFRGEITAIEFLQ